MTFWKDRRVLVTGGAGFIGVNLLERLVSQKARVRMVDTPGHETSKSLAPLWNHIEFIESDLREGAKSLEACQGMSVVFHLASQVGSSDYYHRQAPEVLINNLLIDAHMLAAARQCGVTRYFYASSVHVYPKHLQDRPDARALKEEDSIPADPPLSYGWAKVVGELGVQYACNQDQKFRAAIFRMMNPYGPHQNSDPERGSVIPVLIRKALEYPKTPFGLRSNGEEVRSFCYISDVIDAMLLAIEKLENHNLIGPLNIGSEQSVRIIDLARQIVAVSGKSIKIDVTDLEGVVQGQAIDCSVARDLLDGWEPRTSLKDGLTETYKHVAARLQ